MTGPNPQIPNTRIHEAGAFGIEAAESTTGESAAESTYALTGETGQMPGNNGRHEVQEHVDPYDDVLIPELRPYQVWALLPNAWGAPQMDAPKLVWQPVTPALDKRSAKLIAERLDLPEVMIRPCGEADEVPAMLLRSWYSPPKPSAGSGASAAGAAKVVSCPAGSRQSEPGPDPAGDVPASSVAATATRRKLVPATVLNSAHYRSPARTHRYRIVTSSDAQGTRLHVPTCPEARTATGEGRARTITADARELTLRYVVRRCGCLPHLAAHVHLPDGTRRYRPMAQVVARVAVAALEVSRWQVERWFDAEDEAQAWAESACGGKGQTRFTLLSTCSCP